MTRELLELDGTDGGGQLVRTALTLSVLDARPFRMEHIRGNRTNPGLKRQHLACVDLLAELSDADVSGAEIGSETLTFEPKRTDPGVIVSEAVSGADSDPTAEVGVDVGTAGSVTLVADVLLPLAARISTPVRAALVGGTDVKWSPPIDYLRSVKLPLLRECGLDGAIEVIRRGFYPKGGGELVLEVRPSALEPIWCETKRDAIDAGNPADADAGAVPIEWSVHAVASESLEDAAVADRLAETAATSLVEQDVAADPDVRVIYVDSASPGAVVTLVAEDTSPSESDQPPRPTARAGFSAYGERGVPAEDVATEAVDAALEWAATDAPVDFHLGDQLVVWLALVGGRVRIPHVTDHVRTNVEVVRAFGYDVSIEEESAGPEATLSASMKQQ